MSERKLFFPGLGGNRYEISLEELQKQAYKGKIKRDDKIIVAKIKDGITTEIETTCGKIKVVAESFDQGEADRKAEAERKLAEKQAKEAERLAREKEKKEAKAREKEVKKNRRGKISKKARKMLSLSGDDAFSQAHKGASFLLRLVDTVLWIIVAFNLLCFLISIGIGLLVTFTGNLLEGIGLIVGVVFCYAVFFGLLYLFRKIIAVGIWFPLQVAVYQVNSIKRTMAELATSTRNYELGKASSNEMVIFNGSTSKASTSETVPVPPRES